MPKNARPTDATITSDAGNPRPTRRRKVGRAILTTLLVLTVLGGVALYQLGKEDPRDADFSSLAWGDRVERRLDAFIDGVKPQEADSMEARMKGFLHKVGWK